MFRGVKRPRCKFEAEGLRRTIMRKEKELLRRKVLLSEDMCGSLAGNFRVFKTLFIASYFADIEDCVLFALDLEVVKRLKSEIRTATEQPTRGRQHARPRLHHLRPTIRNRSTTWTTRATMMIRTQPRRNAPRRSSDRSSTSCLLQSTQHTLRIHINCT